MPFGVMLLGVMPLGRLATLQLVELGADVALMMIERDCPVQGMPGDRYARNPGINRQPVQRQVSLDESPVLLPGHLGSQHIDGNG